MRITGTEFKARFVHYDKPSVVRECNSYGVNEIVGSQNDFYNKCKNHFAL